MERINNIDSNKANTDLASCIIQIQVHINDILVKIKETLDNYNVEREENEKKTK